MKVSIITVVYNGAATIASAVDSVVAQDHPDIEYIVIDGGSKDNTVDILKSYGDKIAVLVSERTKASTMR
ncbi:MAG: glycosyltransferase [Bacteroidetes bacterium]|nr:glycosyltransferase [Bacteroidota bacterium]